MEEKAYIQQSTHNKNQAKAEEFLPCSMFQTNRIYLDCRNRTRILQNLAKYDSQKLENVPHIIYFNATRDHAKNEARHDVDEVRTIN